MSVAHPRTPLETVIDALAARGKKPRGNDQGWAALCPAHEDHNPSLSISQGDQGGVVLHCHAGCPPEDVVAALNLIMGDLFDPAARTNGQQPRQQQDTYDYTDELGNLLFQTVRYVPKDFRQRRPDGHGGWLWNLHGIRRVLYRLPEVLTELEAGGQVWVVEGEKDADALAAAGICATCNPMGADSGRGNKWLPGHTDALAGADIVIVADKDDQGRRHARYVAAQLEAAGCTYHVVEAANGKDASTHLAAGLDPTDFLIVDLDQPTEPTPDDDSEDTPDTTPGSTWQPTPLDELITGLADGTLTRPQPTIGRYTTGDTALYYPGRINGLYGESGKGKSWIALALTAEVMADGHVVAWIDIEEPAEGTIGRLLDLGVTADTIANQFIHFAPEESIRVGAALFTELDQRPPALVVIDSTGEALTLEAAGPNNDDEVATWFRIWPRRFANRWGTCVIVIDHVIKDQQNRGLFPGGSQRKRAAISGSAFMVDTIKTLGRGVQGILKLTCAKDRQGTHRQGHKAGEFIFDATGPTITWRLEPPPVTDPDAPFRPTHLMERISSWLADRTDGAFSGKTIIESVTGNKGALNAALARLVEEGYVERRQEGQTHKHRFVKAFVERPVDD